METFSNGKKSWTGPFLVALPGEDPDCFLPGGMYFSDLVGEEGGSRTSILALSSTPLSSLTPTSGSKNNQQRLSTVNPLPHRGAF